MLRPLLVIVQTAGLAQISLIGRSTTAPTSAFALGDLTVKWKPGVLRVAVPYRWEDTRMGPNPRLGSRLSV